MGKITSVEWQFFDFAIVDDFPQFRTFGLRQGSLGLDLHRLGLGPNLQNDFHVANLIDTDFNTIGCRGSETWRFGPNLIYACRQRHYAEDTVIGRLGLALQARGGICDGQIDIWNVGAFLVMNCTDDSTLRCLSLNVA